MCRFTPATPKSSTRRITATRTNNLLAPVEGSNLEAGIKAQLFDGYAMATAAVFEAKQDNYAVRDMTQPEASLPDGSSAYIGVDGTKSRGWEVDFNGEVLPGWTINAGYTHVKVTRAPTDAIYANLPEDYLQLSTQWRLPGAWDRLSIGGGVSWQSAVRGFNIERPTGDGSGATRRSPWCRTRMRWCISMPTTASVSSGPHRLRCAMRSIKPIGRIWIIRTTANRVLSACRYVGVTEVDGDAGA